MKAKALLKLISETLTPCKVCCESKPNSQADRGMVGALPIPNLSNETLYVDFVSMDEFATYDYVLVVVDSLSRFCRFFPCRKTVTGEKAFKILFEGRIQVYGKPKEIVSDNDVRFSSVKGFWQSSLSSLGIKVSFNQPRHPQSNGLCERTNRSFLQTSRIILSQTGSRDWLKIIPQVCWLMNNQPNEKTGYTPHELFLGRPAWIPEVPMDPENNPQVSTWVLEQAELCEKVSETLKELRARKLQRVNKGRVEASYQVGDLVLIHKKRFPQYTSTPKLSSQWFGPYKIWKCNTTW